MVILVIQLIPRKRATKIFRSIYYRGNQNPQEGSFTMAILDWQQIPYNRGTKIFIQA
jgi:hypothetical protein